jgi:protein-S-isoprenylcysteine O-methyltransferase Ste14
MTAFPWVYRFRSYWACAPLLFALFLEYGEVEEDWPIWIAAIGLFLLGMGLRVWAQQHLHHRLRVHKQLSMTGPYRFVRNPLYIGNILICLSATVASELLWLLPITLFWCIGTYSLVIRYEERRLPERYGDAYRRYTSTVPRWIPRLVPGQTLELRNRHFRQSLIVELPSVLLLLPYAIKEFFF